MLLSALVAGTVGWHASPAAAERRTAAQAAARNQALEQQLAGLERAQQVADIATRSLRGTLAAREKEISGLRADLGFYARLVSGNTQREGLTVQEVQLRPVNGAQAWNLTLSLIQTSRHAEEVSGTVTLSVEGVRANKVVALGWDALGDTAQQAGLPFRLRYFQQLQATIVLPTGFKPTRLRIQVQPEGHAPIQRSVAWSTALAGNPDIPPGGN